MSQKNKSMTVKEAFFHDYLVPTGQVAEIYLHQVKKLCSWHHKELSSLLFDNLGLVSTFAISPATRADKKLFQSLTTQVECLQSVLKADLQHVNTAKPDHKQLTAFRSAANTLAGRLKLHVTTLHTCMKFSDDSRGAWLARLAQEPTPLTRQGRYSKWRTLVRNMDFQVNMALQGLAALASDMPLGSHQGREEVPELWRTLFHSDVATATAPSTADAASDYLPAGVTVQSNSVGALAVSCRFDPKKVLKKLLAAVGADAPLPPDITERLVAVDYTAVCGYKELTATVDEAIEWKTNMVQQAEETSQMVVTWQEKDKLAKARAKLQQSLSAEELALLAKSGVLKLADTVPAKPRVSKSAGARRKKATMGA
jgi:hypothetical protein